MSLTVGQIVTVQTVADENDGFTEAPAVVVVAYSDGSYRLRVFGANGVDTTRNYVGEDGEPFDAEAQAAPDGPKPPEQDGQPGTPAQQ